MKAQLSVLATLIALGISGQANATEAKEADSLQQMLDQGKLQGQLRYRYEFVEQQGLPEDAHASTLQARLSYTTGVLNGFKAIFEVDHVALIGEENYNNTYNGNGTYPVVADPKGTEVNRAALQYAANGWQFTAGRQRINLDDQRFVGGVGWRQNEQTYDGYRLVYKPNKQLKFDYSFIYNVNRIFGTDSPKSDLSGELHLVNVGFKFNDKHKATLFGYQLDFDTAAGASSQTLGIRLTGKIMEDLKYNLSYASQSDYGYNPNDYSADYLMAQLSGKFQKVGWKVGYEQLGSDNGVGFSTPLATAHKFQGFADKFLGTPGVGVTDVYVGISGALNGFKLSATYHDFSSDVGSTDYGSELDFTAAYKLTDKRKLLLKYAMYDADAHATDTDKLWFMVQQKF